MRSFGASLNLRPVVGSLALFACAPRQPAPIAATTPTSTAAASPTPTTPASDTVPTREPPRSPASPANIIVPAGGEARVYDLVFTALEVREEQYDHKPEHGNIVAARLHIRPASSPAPSAAEMAQELPALVWVRSDAGPEGSQWSYFRLVMTGGDRNAVVLSVTPMPRAASLGGTPLILPAKAGTGSAAGLSVTVIEVVEKRLMNGNSMMRVTLHLRRAGTPAPKPEQLRAQTDAVVVLTSDPGGDIVTWNGFRVGYLGGWRTEVDLQIVPPALR